MHGRTRTRRLLFSLAVAALVANGCAGTGASVRPAVPGARKTELDQYHRLALAVTKTDGVTVSDADLERIRGRIVDAVRKKQADRYQEIVPIAPGEPTGPTLAVTVQVTRYDKGSAFARAMLAGLGQIHIDARVVLRDAARDVVLGEYDIKKTFAWGGIYGATTRIEDVEVGFAEGVAALVLAPETP